MKPTRPISHEQAQEEERLHPGSEPQRVPQPQPPRTRRRHKAALAGSQNADLEGPKPKRGPRGMST
jgi:hypothetical protein